jgi:molecular chaperone DnaK
MFTKLNLRKNNFFGIRRKLFSVIGMDIGGTNTCIAIMEPSGPRVIENAEGLRTTPSYVSISEDGTEFTAVAAKRIAIQNMYSSFYGTKFFFGSKFSDELVQNFIKEKRFPFKIEKGPNDEVYFMTDQNKHFTPKVVSILFLKYVKEQAEALTGKPIKKIVMSLPKFITDNGKQEIKETVKECGMDVVQFLEEPVSAGYAYNLDKNEKVNKFIVFNLGGLNFSLSYLEKKQNEAAENKEKENEEKEHFEVKSEVYDYFLGGEDFDNIITKFLLNEFERVNKMDVSKELYALQRIKEAAEKAKVELSLSQQAEISLPFLAADQTGPKHLNTRISRSKFETLVDPLITKLKKNCEDFLSKNQIKKEEIDDVILVGGVSRIPRVQEIIKSVFGKEPNKSLNPEEAPAIGASILASQVKLKLDEIKTMDSLPLSIGIESLGGSFVRLIPKDTPLPAKITKTFTTVFDNQPRVDLKFYMGEREVVTENKLLGSVSMIVPLNKKGESKVNVTFNLSNKGDLQIQAVETLSKKSTNYSTKINAGLTQEIVDDIIEVSNNFKDADKAKKD